MLNYWRAPSKHTLDTHILADTPMLSIWNSHAALFTIYCIHKLGCPRWPPTRRVTTIPHQPFTAEGWKCWMDQFFTHKTEKHINILQDLCRYYASIEKLHLFWPHMLSKTSVSLNNRQMLTHKKCHKKHSYIFLLIKFWSYIIKKETTAQQERI